MLRGLVQAALLFSRQLPRNKLNKEGITLLTKVFCFLALVFLLSGNAFAGSDSGLTDGVYYPSFASYKTSLDLFLPLSLKEADVDLKNDNLSASAKAFALQIRQHPDDLAAYVGLLQSSRGSRETLLPEYQIEEKKSPTLTNEFKLGVLAFYLYGEGLHSGNPNSKDQIVLGKIARKNLQKAYDMSHAPLVGFILSDALNYTPGAWDNLALFEDMLKHVGGPTLYQEYVSAKATGWDTVFPSSSHLNKKDLSILARIVSNLWSQNSMTEGTVEEKMIDGTRHIIFGPGTYTVEQQNAMLYLHTWQQQLLKSAASQP